MMKYPTVFHLISAVCEKKNISCVLIGGFAVNHYKVSRSSVDVDFLITKEGYDKILSLLKEDGYKVDYAQEVFARLAPSGDYLMDLDFMFVDKEVLDKIISEGKQISIAGLKFIVPSLFHLIALKLHSIKFNPRREYKDLSDIKELVRVNKINTKNAEFKNLCLRYGTQEFYQKILGETR